MAWRFETNFPAIVSLLPTARDKGRGSQEMHTDCNAIGLGIPLSLTGNIGPGIPLNLIFGMHRWPPYCLYGTTAHQYRTDGSHRPKCYRYMRSVPAQVKTAKWSSKELVQLQEVGKKRKSRGEGSRVILYPFIPFIKSTTNTFLPSSLFG